MKEKVLQFFNVEPTESGRVTLLLIMSFFMGVFVATYSVASQALFLQHYPAKNDLPIALLYSGAFGLVATIVYNFLQNRIPFPLLAALSVAVIAAFTAFIEFGEGMLNDAKQIFFIGFTSFIPFSFIILLVFWGAFGRLFNLRQSKRLLGSVDLGAMIASFIAFFIIPQLFTLIDGFRPETLYTVSLISVTSFLILLIYLGLRYLSTARSFALEKLTYRKVRFTEFFKNRYLRYMSLFVIVSMVAMTFVDFSFLNVTTLYNQGGEKESLAKFISYFEMVIVIFSFLFDQLATDRIIKEYGMRVSMLINPLLIGFFTLSAFMLGSVFGYTKETNFFTIFFIIIAVSKLFLRSLKDTIDDASFKLHLLPIESNIRIDVQTKINGTVTALASLVAGALIYVITNIESFGLLAITMFTLPFLVGWYFITNRMHYSYRETLQNALAKGKDKTKARKTKEYSIGNLLEKEANSTAEDKAIYALTLMEKLEPALFENSVIRLTDSESKRVRAFAEDKIQSLGLNTSAQTEVRSLAEIAASISNDSDVLLIPAEKLSKLSKSGKQSDRIVAAKLLRNLTGPKTIFVLLELLRDVDPRVRVEALFTARKVSRPETWPILVEFLGSPTYSHLAASALIEAGENVLDNLEAAFHKSGQSDIVMLRIVQIMGRIGGKNAFELLWEKADYPDKRIVKQILYSLRYTNYQATGREARDVYNLLEAEMSKTIWNLAALDELPDQVTYKFLKEALQEEVGDNYDQIFMLLSIIYDPQSIQLVRDNLESGDHDNIQFAMELLDLFIEPELKPKLLPLLEDSSTSDKLKQLQLFFPRETYNPIQVVNYILNRDYNFNNRWTKACAIHACAFMDDFRVSRGLVAQMFNNDKLLQETAAWVIYHKDKSTYRKISERLPNRDKRFLDSSIENNQLLDGLNDGFFLFIEMVMFIKQTPAFKNINGLLLADLADKIIALDLDAGERIKLSPDEQDTPVLIVAHGKVKLNGDNNRIVSTLKAGGVSGELFNSSAAKRILGLEAIERSVVFRINLMDFYFVLANHHELVQGLIKNTVEKQLAPEV